MYNSAFPNAERIKPPGTALSKNPAGSREQTGDPADRASRAHSRTASDASLGELDPTIARLVRKLSSKKWVLLYDSLKATFTLQAEGIAREVVFEAMASAAGTASTKAAFWKGDGKVKVKGKGPKEGRRMVGVGGAELDGLSGCIAAWEAYKDWCEEVSTAACWFFFVRVLR